MEANREKESAQKTINQLIAVAKTEGWTIPDVYTAGQYIKCSDESDVISAALSADECTIYFQKNSSGKKHYVEIALSNGIDCIANHTSNDDDDDSRDFEGEVIAPIEKFISELQDSQIA